MEKKHQLMGTEKITKLLIQFSLPAIIGMLVNALYNIVDRIYIGNIERNLDFLLREIEKNKKIKKNSLI